MDILLGALFVAALAGLLWLNAGVITALSCAGTMTSPAAASVMACSRT